MADQDLDQSEEATPYKLEQARKKGQVAKSNDVVAMAILAALSLSVYASGADTLRQALRVQQRILAHAGAGQWNVDAVSHWLGTLLIAMLTLLAPLFLCLVVVAVLANLLQTRPVFSFHPVIPDLTKLNPANGFKRVFSMRTLFEACKSMVKLCVLIWVLYHAVRDLVPGLIGLPLASPKIYMHVLVDLAGALLGKLVLAMLVIAMLDLLFTRWEFGKRMRMSKRDIKDENKNREGDPRIRARLRDLRREMLKRSRSLAQVPSADVLITNPTHIAVAISYKHGSGVGPQVVAKGAGDMAAAMRKLASRHQIPVVQNKPLARTLFREVDYDGYVPEKLYPQLAKIMVWVFAMRKMKR
jgi:flagellar biosynthetic protein FlhB